MKTKILSGLLAAALGLTAQAAHSASITVDASGICTLAEAIDSANGNANTGGCVGSGAYGADTITLQADVTLSADLPQITSTITIEGGGHFISGNNARRVLYVAGSGNLTLNTTTIKDGKTASYGGGIYNSGTVTLNNSTVSGNTASIFGGGIYNSGTVTLNNCTVSGNTADYGGGIINYSTIMLTNSTVSGNNAIGGGGINNDDTVTLINSTVSGNSASNQGGGIRSYYGTASLHSSIISGNTALTGNEVYKNSDSGTVSANSRNLFGHGGETSAQAFYNFTPGASDVNAASDGGAPAELSVILSPLANNGGPTQTHTLPAGSPAVDRDATCSTGLSTDQRGYTRQINFKCDAGAVEYSPSFSLASGNGRDLPASTWLMTAPPCQPVPTDINSQYNSDIPGGDYDSNWTAYAWDASEQIYIHLPYNGVMHPGEGNWLYSTIAATLTVTGTATPSEPCSNYGSGLSGNCFAIDLTPSSTARWQIVGHPFPYSVSWADVRVATYNGSAWTQRTPSQAAADNIMAKEMWRWSGSAYETKDDATGGLIGTLQPQEAVWVRMLTGSSAFSAGDFKLLIPAR